MAHCSKVNLADWPEFLGEKKPEVKKKRGRPQTGDPTRRKYTLEEVRAVLEKIPADSRTDWRNFGIILGREFARSDEAWAIYLEWADRWTGNRKRDHKQQMHDAFYIASQESIVTGLTLGTIIKEAIDHGWAPEAQGKVPPGQFVFFGPGNNFIYRVTGSPSWLAAAVDAVCPPVNVDGQLLRPSEWIRRNRRATSMTKDPNIPGDYIEGVDAYEGALVDAPGAAVFNTYRRPTIILGDAAKATPFTEHVRRVFPRSGDADQFLDYMAHRAQRPGEKPRFALLIAGPQGVGKDTAIEMCVPAIGGSNVANIEPSAFDAGFNEYAASTLVRVSEAANTHDDMSRVVLNERMKNLIAGTPDAISINPKYGHKYSVRMYCGVIITTNHLTSAVHIPADDRRYDVIEAATKKEMGIEEQAKCRQYFDELWGWFTGGGAAHVAACLMSRDLSKFSAASGQRHTEAHRTIVAAGLTSDQWLHDVLDMLDWPDAIRSDAILATFKMHGGDPERVYRSMTHAMTRAGYRFHRNPDRNDGRWPYDDKNKSALRVAVYGKEALTPKEVENLRAQLKNG